MIDVIHVQRVGWYSSEMTSDDRKEVAIKYGGSSLNLARDNYDRSLNPARAIDLREEITLSSAHSFV